jgi:hypothetical protein
LTLRVASDFAGAFKERGLTRKTRGQDLPVEVTADRVILAYRGLDYVVRRTLNQVR